MRALAEAENARSKGSGLPADLQKEFEYNILLGEELEKLIGLEETLTKKRQGKQAQLKELEEDFALAREKVETAVLTEAIGIALRAQRSSLLGLSTNRQDSAQRRLEMGNIREAQLDVERKHRDLADLDSQGDQVSHLLRSMDRSK